MIEAEELMQAILESQQTLFDEYDLLIEQLNRFYECHRCIPNWCCTTVPVCLLFEEIPLLAQYMGLSRNKFLNKYCEITNEFMGIPSIYLKTPCPFFKKGIKQRRYSSCRIYKIRPGVCKRFPFAQMPGVRCIDRCPLASEIAKDLKILEKMYSSEEIPYELSDIEKITNRFREMLKETDEWSTISEKMGLKRFEEMDYETFRHEQFNLEEKILQHNLPKNKHKSWDSATAVVQLPYFRDLLRLKRREFICEKEGVDISRGKVNVPPKQRGEPE